MTLEDSNLQSLLETILRKDVDDWAVETMLGHFLFHVTNRQHVAASLDDAHRLRGQNDPNDSRLSSTVQYSTAPALRSAMS
jgi:hypothetical protein